MIYEFFVVADHEYDIHFVIYGFSTEDIAIGPRNINLLSGIFNFRHIIY